MFLLFDILFVKQTTKVINMNREKMISKLKGYIYSKYKNASAYADEKGLTKSFVSAVITGKKNPNQSILDDIGLKMEKNYSFVEKKECK